MIPNERLLELFPEWNTLSPRRRKVIRKRREELESYIDKHPYLDGIYDLNIVNDIIMPRSTTTADTTRGFSTAIWGSCPFEQLRASNERGHTFYDDFDMIGNANMSSAYANSIGQWSAYGYAGAQINDAQLEGGIIKMSSDGDNEGLAILGSAGSFRMVTTSTLALNSKLWFEARVARHSIATAHMEFFVGLMAPTLSSGIPATAQPITTTDDTLMTAGDLFGFHCVGATATRGGPTEVGVAFELASGTINYPTNMTTLMASSGNTVLAADTFVKLGFIFDRNGPFKRISSATARQTAGQVKRAIVQFYINNIPLPAFLTTDDVANATATQAFPTAFMTPVIAMMNQASQSSDYLAADWIRVAQGATL